MKYTAPALLAIMLIAGCQSRGTGRHAWDGAGPIGAPLEGDIALDTAADSIQADRMLIWEGSITLEVSGVIDAQEKITAYAKGVGGYVESTSQRKYGERPSVSLTLRIPAEKLRQVVGTLESMGEVMQKSLSSEDITERYIDTEARLATKIKLRDRLAALLEKAEKVEDILAVEKELTRLQGDIDSMTARLKAMKGRVEYASLSVTLNALKQKQEKVLGPLGYVWEGAAWTIRKLFVWKEEAYVYPEAAVIEPVEHADAASVDTMFKERIVYPDETIDSIAMEYGVSAAQLRALNHIAENEDVRAGQRLRIPVVE